MLLVPNFNPLITALDYFLFRLPSLTFVTFQLQVPFNNLHLQVFFVTIRKLTSQLLLLLFFNPVNLKSHFFYFFFLFLLLIYSCRQVSITCILEFGVLSYFVLILFFTAFLLFLLQRFVLSPILWHSFYTSLAWIFPRFAGF